MISSEVNQLIASHGTDITYTSINAGAVDPVTQIKTTNPVNYPIKALISGFSVEEINGTSITDSDLKVSFLNTSIAIKQNDEVLLNGVTYTVVRKYREVIYRGNTVLQIAQIRI